MRILSDILRTIRDPEKPSTLEDLHVVYEEGIFVQSPTSDNVQVVRRNHFKSTHWIWLTPFCFQIRVEFNPTVPHCSLATLIGLCIRVKIERNIQHKLKLDIYIKKGAHTTEDESKYSMLDLTLWAAIDDSFISVNKQINDKERIAAAMENPNLKNLVEDCIKEEE